MFEVGEEASIEKKGMKGKKKCKNSMKIVAAPC